MIVSPIIYCSNAVPAFAAGLDDRGSLLFFLYYLAWIVGFFLILGIVGFVITVIIRTVIRKKRDRV